VRSVVFVMILTLVITMLTANGRGSVAAAAECPLRVGPGIPPPSSVPSGIPGFHAAWYGQSGYPTLCPGQIAGAVVAYYNSGSLGWTWRHPEVAFLGTSGPNPGQDQPSLLGGDGTHGSFNTRWPAHNRPAVMPILFGPTGPSAYVGPGQVAWFQFTVKAPQTPGTYRLYIRPLIEHTTWMEDYGVYWQVTVVPANPPQRVTVTSIDKAADTFTTASGTFRYDANDTYEYADAVIDYGRFDGGLLSNGDVVDVRYEPTSDGVSSFNVVSHVGSEPAKVNVQVGSYDSGPTKNDINVTLVVPPPAEVRFYDSQRALVPAGTAVCEATTGHYQILDMPISFYQSGSFVDKNLPSGTYCYRSGIHNQLAHWTAFGYSTPVTVPAP
jgi:hypothetical protein